MIPLEIVLEVVLKVVVSAFGLWLFNFWIKKAEVRVLLSTKGGSARQSTAFMILWLLATTGFVALSFAIWWS